jgi:hypothetical protein
MSIDSIKLNITDIGSQYKDREIRARRLFIQDSPVAFSQDRAREFEIKCQISDFFDIPYASIKFCGSAQLGYSVHKDRPFTRKSSDLDVAIISADIFQLIWKDLITTTRSFTDLSPFGYAQKAEVERLKSCISKRGMINVSQLPNSKLKVKCDAFLHELGQAHSDMFSKITAAVYLNEYAFCWKQDAALNEFIKGAADAK